MQTAPEHPGIRKIMIHGRSHQRGVLYAEASITVEASLCLPLFLFALLAICRLFLCIETEYRIREGIYAAAKEMSCTAYLAKKLADATGNTVETSVTEELSGTKEDAENTEDREAGAENSSVQGDKDASENKQAAGGEPDTDEAEQIKDREELLKAEEAVVSGAFGWIARRAVHTVFIGEGVMSALTERGFDITLLRGGKAPNGLKIENVSFAGSKITDDEVMDIHFSCDLCIPTLILGTIRYPVREELKYRVFSGLKVKSLLTVQNTENGDSTSGQTVYVTESGSVYHTSPDCPSLRISVRAVSYGNLEHERSDSGARYYPCEKCAKGTAPDTVYITSDGNRYHHRIDCSALKRSVSEIDISEAGDRTECRRCP